MGGCLKDALYLYPFRLQPHSRCDELFVATLTIDYNTVRVSIPTAVMDQRIFEQLDMLERGARMDSCPTRDVYNDSSAEFSAYDEAQPDYHGMEPYHQAEDEFMDQPMVLDSFGTRPVTAAYVFGTD